MLKGDVWMPWCGTVRGWLLDDSKEVEVEWKSIEEVIRQHMTQFYLTEDMILNKKL